MSGDIESVASIVACAAGRTPGGELSFTFPEVLRVIEICTSSGIAVLGVDLFEIRADGYSTEALSSYSYDREIQQQLHDTLQRHGWPKYVGLANELATGFIHEHPAGDDHVYLLTTSSWREFGELQKIKRR
jgi:hypothetical protein